MVIVKSMRGPFRVVDVYYPRLPEAEQVVDRLAFNEIIYIRQMPATLPPARFSTSGVRFETSLLDLTRDEDSLLTDMNRTCRYQLRKADRLRHRIKVRQNDSSAYRDFLAIHNDFVSLKKHSERLSQRRLDAFKPSSDIFVAYFDGRPVCGHLVLRDNELRRVGVLLTVSTRLRTEESSVFISSLNRWLHWCEMRQYKSEGMQVYDFCGSGADTPEKAGIAYFKQSFGGARVTEHNYVFARIPGRAAVSLFYAMRRIRSATSGYHLRKFRHPLDLTRS